VRDLAKRVNLKKSLSWCTSSVGIPLWVLYYTGTCLCMYGIRTAYNVFCT